jgi:hypothetical protein
MWSVIRAESALRNRAGGAIMLSVMIAELYTDSAESQVRDESPVYAPGAGGQFGGRPPASTWFGERGN